MILKKKKSRGPHRPDAAVKALKRPFASGTWAFPIIGIGASAGGLEALESFFSHVPADCNMAFVVIQHLDPAHKSIMSSLLKKYTAMEIAEITDGMGVDKNRVYLAPPDRNIAVIENTLHHVTPEKNHGFNLPIDYFFRSLAEDQGKRSIGIILSGTGTDGTLGLKEIKAAGGMAMVQEETQAKYSGMPRSAIDTGLVDFILPVEKMPGHLIQYASHPYLEAAKTAKTTDGDFQTNTRKILLLIRGKTGHDFSLYKNTTIQRRIERRMALHQIERIADYVRYMERNPPEIESLFKEILINVTRFFRDPKAFEALDKKGIPDLLEGKERDAFFRIWVPGCSTGEEAYGLAMLLTEAMEKRKKRCTLQVFASDIDAEAIEVGRRAVYPESIKADVSKERLDRFFIKEDKTYRVKKYIRECVVFALQDLAKDPPFSRLDLISCRNLLIYMDHALQMKILPMFHYSLVDRGVLFLGTSESLGEFVGSFSPIDTKWKMYRRKGAGRAVYPDRIPAALPGKALAPDRAGFRSLGEKVIARVFAPPSVLVNEKFDVLYCYGPIDRFLAVPSGEASLNVLRIAREGLRNKLATALSEALKGTIPVTVENVGVGSDGNVRTVDLVVQPILEPGETQRLMMIVFKEKTDIKAPVKKLKRADAPAPKNGEMETLKQELIATRDHLQNTIEELQTANEEFQSTNEELQSANEELETSKEELQSTNEELVTVNSELQHKIDQLTETSNDVNNLLASTEIASVFLDMELRIKRFTPATAKIFRLLQTDIGRSIRDITSNIASFNVYAAAEDVLATLMRKEVEVKNEDGKWFTLRIIPYRTMDNTIEGVVITFIDISDLKRIQKL
jgi:two-component system, chemotaxis family, CheB/CheR fusion protein